MKQRTYIFSLVLLTLMVLGFWSCKKKSVPEETTTDLEVEIKNIEANNGTISFDVANISVFIFESEEAYIKAVNSKSIVDIESFSTRFDETNSDGKVVFQDMNPNVNYFVYAIKIQNGVIFNNYYSQYKLANKLAGYSFVSLLMELKPFETGDIIFVSKDPTLIGSTISVTISKVKDAQGEIVNLTTDLTNSTVLVDDENKTNKANTTIRYQGYGTYVWNAKNDKGCSWQGEIVLNDEKIKAGLTVTETLSSCSTGFVTFWTKDNSFKNGESIDIKVNFANNTQTKSVKGSLNSRPETCNIENVATFSLPVGNTKYVYKAEKSDKSCVWVEEFTVLNSGCNNFVEIPACLSKD